MEVTTTKAIELICKYDEIGKAFEDFICESEMENVRERIGCFLRGCMDYSLGLNNPNSLTICDSKYTEFLDGVLKSIREYGCSAKLWELARQCNNLRNSNLFEYKVEQLCQLYFTEEIKSSYDWIEEVGYAIYAKSPNEVRKLCGDKVECFIADGNFDIYKEDEDKNLYKVLKVR